MATPVPELTLAKPADTDRYDVGIVNTNSDHIMEFAAAARTAIQELQAAVAALQEANSDA